MRALILLLLGLARLTAASAHGHEEGGASWTLDGWILVPLLLSIALYGIGLTRLWRRSSGATRPARGRQGLTYVAGWLTLAAAVVTPFHWLGEHLFSCHMIEHEIIMAVSAPLFVAARPIGVLLWGLPTSMRLWLPRALQWSVWKQCWAWLMRPVNATVLHGVAIWVWHIPALFDAAVVDSTLHRLQHTSFLVTALLFWYSLMQTSRSGEAVWHLFFTMLHTSLLGALLAVAPRVLYATQTSHSLDWGLTALEDQQLAGIVMWVPAGTVYAAAALFYAARWIQGSARKAGRPNGSSLRRTLAK
jgi:cytochrome c oxidase assembly factor CtaG